MVKEGHAGGERQIKGEVKGGKKERRKGKSGGEKEKERDTNVEENGR